MRMREYPPQSRSPIARRRPTSAGTDSCTIPSRTPKSTTRKCAGRDARASWQWRRSGRELQNLSNLRWTVDLARIARHPWRVHCLLGDLVEVLAADVDVAERSRHAEPADQLIERVAGVLARLTHSGRDLRLARGVDRLVPAHHRRQHHATGVAVRHVEPAAEDVADAVARAHRHA